MFIFVIYTAHNIEHAEYSIVLFRCDMWEGSTT